MRIRDSRDDDNLFESTSEEDVGMGTRSSRRNIPLPKVKTRKKKKKKTKDRTKSNPIEIVEGVIPTSVPRAYNLPNVDNLVAENVTAESVVLCKCKKIFTMLTISNHLARLCTYRHDSATIESRKEKARQAKVKYRSTPLEKVQIFKSNYIFNFMKKSPEPEQYSTPVDENSLESCWFKTKENLNEYTVVDAFQKQPFISISRFSGDISAHVLSSLLFFTNNC